MRVGIGTLQWFCGEDVNISTKSKINAPQFPGGSKIIDLSEAIILPVNYGSTKKFA